MTIQRMDHVGIVVDDLEAAIAFFVDFGLELQHEGSFHSPPTPPSDPQAPANTPGLSHLTFAVEDIESLLARLQPHGAELVGDLERYGGYQLCYIRGPEGIIIELAEKTG